MLKGAFYYLEVMKVAVFIDGGHVRVLAKTAGFHYDPDFIEKFAHNCVSNGETLIRILYYDCAPYSGKQKKPVSGEFQEFKGSGDWLHVLAQKNLFAVRLGVLKFRGYKPVSVPISDELSDDDFKPDFEQKGVDMRIGLDIASYSASKAIDRIILVSGDTDCIPAMKHGRKAGLQIVLVTFPGHHVAAEMLEHADYKRDVAWPKQEKKIIKKAKI